MNFSMSASYIFLKFTRDGRSSFDRFPFIYLRACGSKAVLVHRKEGYQRLSLARTIIADMRENVVLRETK